MQVVVARQLWQQEQEFRVGEVQGMQRVAELKKVLAKTKGMVYRSCVILAMLSGSETWCLRSNFEKDRESNGESNVWCKTDRDKEDRAPNGDVGIERNSGSDGKGEWSEMVRACV